MKGLSIIERVVVAATTAGKAAIVAAVIAAVGAVLTAGIEWYGKQRGGEQFNQEEKRKRQGALFSLLRTERKTQEQRDACQRALSELEAVTYDDDVNLVLVTALSRLPNTPVPEETLRFVREWLRYDRRPYIFRAPLLRRIGRPPQQPPAAK